MVELARGSVAPHVATSPFAVTPNGGMVPHGMVPAWAAEIAHGGDGQPHNAGGKAKRQRSRGTRPKGNSPQQASTSTNSPFAQHFALDGSSNTVHGGQAAGSPFSGSANGAGAPDNGDTNMDAAASDAALDEHATLKREI